MIEFIFWKYVEPESDVSDDDVKSFLEVRDHWKFIDYTSAMRALKTKKMWRCCVFMHLKNNNFQDAIEECIKLLETYDYRGNKYALLDGEKEFEVKRIRVIQMEETEESKRKKDEYEKK